MTSQPPRRDHLRVLKRALSRPLCGIEGCDRPLFDPEAAERKPHILHRCGLHEIARLDPNELREWGEQNAAEMVDIAHQALAAESPESIPPAPA